MTKHAWKRLIGERWWFAWCGVRLDKLRGHHTVPQDEVECLHCLRALRDDALWKAQHFAGLAKDFTERLESQRRARARRTTSRRKA